MPKTFKCFLTIMIMGFLASCATGEKFSDIEEGMTKAEVRKVLGKQDQVDKPGEGWTIYYYKHRLISGWSWDKTDYYVILNPQDKVFAYGHGPVDTRMSERMTKWSIEQQKLTLERQKLIQSQQPVLNNNSVNCRSFVLGDAVQTNCR